MTSASDFYSFDSCETNHWLLLQNLRTKNYQNAKWNSIQCTDPMFAQTMPLHRRHTPNQAHGQPFGFPTTAGFKNDSSWQSNLVRQITVLQPRLQQCGVATGVWQRRIAQTGVHGRQRRGAVEIAHAAKKRIGNDDVGVIAHHCAGKHSGLNRRKRQPKNNPHTVSIKKASPKTNAEARRLVKMV